MENTICLDITELTYEEFDIFIKSFGYPSALKNEFIRIRGFKYLYTVPRLNWYETINSDWALTTVKPVDEDLIIKYLTTDDIKYYLNLLNTFNTSFSSYTENLKGKTLCKLDK